MKFYACFLFVLGLFACKPNGFVQPNDDLSSGQVLLLCDDANVDNWYGYIDSFDKYHLAVTFYVSQFHQLSPLQITKLKELENHGHEIAFHSLYNQEIENTPSQKELTIYLKTDIDSGIQLMKAQGFKPKNFAFPGDKAPQIYRDSLAKRFQIIRGGNFGIFEYWERRKSYSLKREIREPFWCYSITNSALFKPDKTWYMLAEDIKQGKNVALLFHRLSTDSSDYSTQAEHFFALVRLLDAHGASFSTVSAFWK